MEEESARKKLVKIIRETKERFLAVGETTSRAVADDVIHNHQDLIDELGDELAEQKVRDMVVEEMRKGTLEEDDRQWRLPFEIPGISTTISYERSVYAEFSRVPQTQTYYLSLRKATDGDLAAHEQLLKNQIDADTRRLGAVRVLRRQLSSIFSEHPGINVEQACGLWNAQGGQVA